MIGNVNYPRDFCMQEIQHLSSAYYIGKGGEYTKVYTLQYVCTYSIVLQKFSLINTCTCTVTQLNLLKFSSSLMYALLAPTCHNNIVSLKKTPMKG